MFVVFRIYLLWYNNVWFEIFLIALIKPYAMGLCCLSWSCWCNKFKCICAWLSLSWCWCIAYQWMGSWWSPSWRCMMYPIYLWIGVWWPLSLYRCITYSHESAIAINVPWDCILQIKFFKPFPHTKELYKIVKNWLLCTSEYKHHLNLVILVCIKHYKKTQYPWNLCCLEEESLHQIM